MRKNSQAAYAGRSSCISEINFVKFHETNKKAWNKNSQRYQSENSLTINMLDFGDPRCLTNTELKLVTNVDKKIILELGFGAANIGIYLAKKGAIVKGIDISSEQLKLAEIAAKKEVVNISFELAAIEDYQLKKNYDIVISICAFQYVQNLLKRYLNKETELQFQQYMV